MVYSDHKDLFQLSPFDARRVHEPFIFFLFCSCRYMAQLRESSLQLKECQQRLAAAEAELAVRTETLQRWVTAC
jgi:hypothetical protein